MKIISILLLLLLATIPLKSQDVTAFIDSSSVWYQSFEYYSVEEYYKYYYIYSINGDTIINNNEYKKLFYSDIDNYKLYYGAIREENGKVFYRGKSEEFNRCLGYLDTLEILLYDFNATIEDTIYHLYDCSSIVQEKDSILLLDGKYRKRYYLDRDDFWIEDIGSTHGLLYPLLMEHEWQYSLTCFKSKGELIYTNPWSSTCYTGIADNNYVYLYIYPNPFRDKLHIKTHEDLKYINIKIFNILGQNVYNGKYCDSEIIVDKKLKNGIYLIYIETEKYTIVKKVIKIN